jgi:hypothetical protein
MRNGIFGNVNPDNLRRYLREEARPVAFAASDI